MSGRLCAIFISFVILICFPKLIIADTWQPAQFGQHPESLAKMIKFPEVEGNFTTYVRCEAKIFPGGSIDEVGCYNDPKVDDVFFRAIHIGANGATVQPAKVGGEEVSVLTLFTVVFAQKDGQQMVATVPNHGTNVKALGMNYIAPQKYGRSNKYHPRTELGLLWLDATMSVSGEASNIKQIKTKRSNTETRRYAKRYLTDNTFIPGFYNGEPTEMRFVKPIFGYRNGFLWNADKTKCRDSRTTCDEQSNATGKPRFVFDD